MNKFPCVYLLQAGECKFFTQFQKTWEEPFSAAPYTFGIQGQSQRPSPPNTNLFLMGVLNVLGAGEDSLLELMLLVVDMEATEQLEERSSLLPPLEAVDVVERLSEVNTPTRSPVSGFTANYQSHSSVNTPRNLSIGDSVLHKADQYYK